MPARSKRAFKFGIHRRKGFSRPRGIEPAWVEVSTIKWTVPRYICRMQELGRDERAEMI